VFGAYSGSIAAIVVNAFVDATVATAALKRTGAFSDPAKEGGGS